jgi:hypothetical protein
MISSSDDQLRVRHSLREQMKRLDHQFEPLVSSPFAESENAVLRIATPGEIRIFGCSAQDAV